MFGLKKKKNKAVLPDNIEELIDKTKKKKKSKSKKVKTESISNKLFSKKILSVLLVVFVVLFAIFSILYFDLIDLKSDNSNIEDNNSNEVVDDQDEPYVTIMCNVSEGESPLKVFFNCTYGNFLNTSLMKYSWDFGDGGKSVNPELAYIFVQEGEYVVNLTIVDNEGVEASDNIVILVS